MERNLSVDANLTPTSAQKEVKKKGKITMLRVHINFENGDSFTTRFNGTPEEAAHFYKLDRLFNIGIVEDNIQPVESLMIEKA